MKQFIISDTHFGHANIIKYCDRPFHSAPYMDQVMIANWNEVVGDDDIVYHIGDFSLGKEQFASDTMKQLNGRKALILGNHDRSRGQMRNIGFESVSHHDGISFGETGRPKRLYLTHRPPDPLAVPRGYDYVIHGHTHKSEMITAPGIFNASVEAIGYKPVPLEYVVCKLMQSKEK